MESVVLSRLVCLLYVILLPAVWADYCRGYWDSNGNYYEPWQCGIQYCCGNCNKKYCCTEEKNHLSQKDQELCPGRPINAKSYSTVTLGSFMWSLLPFIIFVGGIICCCVAPCYFIYKCIKGCCRRRTHTSTVAMTTITPDNTPQLPQQPFLPDIRYQQSYPGRSVPVPPAYEGPSAPIEPPPSYMESEAQAHSPGVFTHGQPTYSFQRRPYTSPPYSDELAQPPYNPSYDRNPPNI